MRQQSEMTSLCKNMFKIIKQQAKANIDQYKVFNYTVEPPYSGHTWDPAFCPLWRGCPLSEVSFHRVGVLSVCPLSRGLSSLGVSFIGGFTVMVNSPIPVWEIMPK